MGKDNQPDFLFDNEFQESDRPDFPAFNWVEVPRTALGAEIDQRLSDELAANRALRASVRNS